MAYQREMEVPYAIAISSCCCLRRAIKWKWYGSFTSSVETIAIVSEATKLMMVATINGYGDGTSRTAWVKLWLST